MTNQKPVHRPLLAAIKTALADRRLARSLGRLAAAGALAPLAALANPTGGQVAGGSATISTPSAKGTVINQSSQRAVINWQQFSVGADQYVQFVQPSSSAVVLNRVIGSNPSQIFGNITANGQVFLVNPNGILFAPGATLDVAGLVASSLEVSDVDFMQGNYVFTRGPSVTPAVVQNQGSIVAGAGGYVVLAGDYVENDGHIDAQSGRVYLAAGNSATLTFDKNQLISYAVNGATLARLAGVSNTGEITATGGAVVMTADVGNALIATAVNNSGFIAAHSIKSAGGVIELLAEGGTLSNSGTLDASAADAGVAGGAVLLRGNGHTQLEPGSVIDAEGDGASGGFVELSGHTLNIAGQVDPGRGGDLLIDPVKLHIVPGTGAGTPSTTSIFKVGAGYIQNELNLGVGVTLVASNSITNAGVSALTATGAGKGALTIKTGTVAVGASGTLANIAASHCVSAGVCQPGSAIKFTATSGTIDFTTSPMSININGAFTANANQGTVKLSTVQASAVTIKGGTITLSGNVTASAGKLSVAANHGPPTAAVITVASGKTLSGKSVNIQASGSYGGKISAGAVTATGGSVNISADDTGLASGSATITAGKLSGKMVSMLVLGPVKVGLNVGAISAERIDISASGKSDTVVTGALTAVNSADSAFARIAVTASVTGTLTVNGDVTVSGKPHATYATGLGAVDLPQAATLSLGVGGSGNGVRTVQVNGAIKVNATAAAYSGHSHNEAGVVNNRNQKGVGGLAEADVFAAGSHGAASVTGSIAAKGPDAFVVAQARSVTLHNITVTGSGHHVSRSITPRSVGTNLPAKNSYASSNSAGQAELLLGTVPAPTSTGVAGVSATVKAGNITVSGKGAAHVGLLASNVSAGNIAVTTTAAKGKVKQRGNVFGNVRCSGINCNSGEFFRGPKGVPLHSGSLSLGAAEVQIDGGTGFGNGGGSSGPRAVSIKAGSVSVSGVGAARVGLSGKTITTLGLKAAATKGTEKGTGSSQSGGTAATTFAHTFDVNGGGAEIKLRSGGSGSHSSGVLTLNGGPVTIGGSVSVTGPAAALEVKGKTIKLGGTVTLTGSGGSLTSDTVVTPHTGTGYHTHFSGTPPTTMNLEGATSGSLSVAGKTSIKAPGLIGAIAVAGAVQLHGVSGSASTAKTFSVLDTRVSATAQNFTAASFGLIVADVKAVGGAPVFASASDAGNVTLKSKGNVNLPSAIKIGGTLNVQAVGNITGSAGTLVKRINSVEDARPRAGSHSGGGPGSGANLPHLGATADAVSMVAGKGINLAGSQLNIGKGSVSSVHGDAGLLAGLALEGLAPAASNPNGDFIAGGPVTLGGLNLTGSYLLLQGTAVSVLGKVSVPKGTLVQVAPFDPTAAIDIENSKLLQAALGRTVITAATGPANFGLTNASFLSLFPGDTVAVGNSLEAGDVTLGANGPLDIGTTNLIIFTTGGITGLGTVTSTGIVQSLLAFLGPPVPPVTAGEIDPGAGSGTNTGLGDQTDKRKIGGGGDEGGGSQPAGTVSQDSGNASVCH